ncbi:MAG: hypothetical protein Q4G34_11375, partial [Micrococcus sp.]|nr:hypothetical protein [Micrococcus sp.]
MARLPAPLPDGVGPVVTPSDLRAARLHPDRTRRADIVRVQHGIYRTDDTASTAWEQLGRLPPAHGRSPEHLAALLRVRPDAVLSHETAAHLHGIPFPHSHARMASDDLLGARTTAVQFTVDRPGSRMRRDGVLDHRRPLPAAHIAQILGLRVTSLERTWLDLCSLGFPWLVDDLVAAGDHCVKRPWTPSGRAAPLSSIDALRRTLADVGRFKGIKNARHSLDLIRVGADSPPETRMRLACIDAGLGEPLLQYRIDSDDLFCPELDAAFPEWRAALQYDGFHHLTAAQQARDAHRDRYCQERGWVTFRATAQDARENFRGLIEAVRRRRAQITGAEPRRMTPLVELSGRISV